MVLAVVSLLTFSATAQAPNDVRIALIIGNSAYPGNMALANPSNDAKDMAATLRNMGFGVIELRDASRAEMTEGIERANHALKGKRGVGMLFYAGHGLQLDWRNYMVPVDAKLHSSIDVPAHTIDIEVVMNAFKSAGNRMNIVVLDACRDNPFADGKTASGKGLAPLDAPTGTFLAYATAPGNVAADGGTGSKNGLYTGYLLQELQKPSARIEDVFKRVRFAVRQASNGAQIPWEATSLEDDFIFNSGIRTAVKLSEAEKDNLFDSESTDWDKIKDSTNANDVYAFLQKYPSGLFSQGAMGVLNRLNRAKVTAYTDRSGIRHDANQVVYRVGDSVEISRKDGDTGQEIRTRSPRIESIENGIVRIADGGILTTRGEVIRGQGNNYNPPRPMLPADGLVVGKKWISRSVFTPVRPMTSGLGGDIQTMLVQANNFRRNEILRPPIGARSPNLIPRPESPNRMPNRTSAGNWIEEQGQVLALETITVPAGTFKAFKIEVTSSSPNGTDVKSTYWMLPDFGFPIKQQLEMRRPSGRINRWTEQVINITRGA